MSRLAQCDSGVVLAAFDSIKDGPMRRGRSAQLLQPIPTKYTSQLWNYQSRFVLFYSRTIYKIDRASITVLFEFNVRIILFSVLNYTHWVLQWRLKIIVWIVFCSRDRSKIHHVFNRSNTRLGQLGTKARI